jgi:hypothetical protein
MAPRICVSVLALAIASAPAMAAVKGQCTYKGKNVAYADGVAAMAPDPFEETEKVPTIWLVSVPFAAGELAGKAPKDLDDAVTQHSFDKDSSSLQLRLDKAGKVVEGLQLYVPPGTSYSMSSNEVGKLAMKGAFSAKAAGSWSLADEDMKCNLSFDLASGPGGKVAAAATPAPPAKPWGTPLPAGGGAPGAAYMAMHKATLAGDVNAMLKLATKERAAEMEKSRKQPEFAGMIELIKAMEPTEAHVVSGQANATKAELQIAGKDSDGSSMKGTATLLNEGGAWKIEKVETSSSSH